VLFHDYDRPERGGVAHLGVRIFLDALLSAGVLREVEHVGRVLAGRVDDPSAARIPVSACAAAWRAIGTRVAAVRAIGFDGWRVVGEKDARSELLSFLFGLEGAAWSTELRPEEAPQRLVVLERPLSKRARSLLKDGAGDRVLLDDLLIAYQLEHALHHRRDALLARVRNRPEFFRWEEYLEMLEHACPARDAETRFDADGLDLDALSRSAARELLRVAFLERLARSLLEGQAA
jgi:hypothetical protein